jgi:hypothetical protein
MSDGLAPIPSRAPTAPHVHPTSHNKPIHPKKPTAPRSGIHPKKPINPRSADPKANITEVTKRITSGRADVAPMGGLGTKDPARVSYGNGSPNEPKEPVTPEGFHVVKIIDETNHTFRYKVVRDSPKISK